MDWNDESEVQNEEMAIELLLQPHSDSGADWVVKLENIRNVKRLRLQRQALRKGKPITFAGRWAATA